MEDRDSSPDYESGIPAIANELADIFYCVLRIADRYGIDLAKAHQEARLCELEYAGAVKAARTQ